MNIFNPFKRFFAYLRYWFFGAKKVKEILSMLEEKNLPSYDDPKLLARELTKHFAKIHDIYKSYKIYYYDPSSAKEIDQKLKAILSYLREILIKNDIIARDNRDRSIIPEKVYDKNLSLAFGENSSCDTSFKDSNTSKSVAGALVLNGMSFVYDPVKAILEWDKVPFKGYLLDWIANFNQHMQAACNALRKNFFLGEQQEISEYFKHIRDKYASKVKPYMLDIIINNNKDLKKEAFSGKSIECVAHIQSKLLCIFMNNMARIKSIYDHYNTCTASRSHLPLARKIAFSIAHNDFIEKIRKQIEKLNEELFHWYKFVTNGEFFKEGEINCYKQFFEYTIRNHSHQLLQYCKIFNILPQKFSYKTDAEYRNYGKIFSIVEIDSEEYQKLDREKFDTVMAMLQEDKFPTLEQCNGDINQWFLTLQQYYDKINQQIFSDDFLRDPEALAELEKVFNIMLFNKGRLLNTYGIHLATDPHEYRFPKVTLTQDFALCVQKHLVDFIYLFRSIQNNQLKFYVDDTKVHNVNHCANQYALEQYQEWNNKFMQLYNLATNPEFSSAETISHCKKLAQEWIPHWSMSADLKEGWFLSHEKIHNPEDFAKHGLLKFRTEQLGDFESKKFDILLAKYPFPVIANFDNITEYAKALNKYFAKLHHDFKSESALMCKKLQDRNYEICANKSFQELLKTHHIGYDAYSSLPYPTFYVNIEYHIRYYIQSLQTLVINGSKDKMPEILAEWSQKLYKLYDYANNSQYFSHCKRKRLKKIFSEELKFILPSINPTLRKFFGMEVINITTNEELNIVLRDHILLENSLLSLHYDASAISMMSQSAKNMALKELKLQAFDEKVRQLYEFMKIENQKTFEEMLDTWNKEISEMYIMYGVTEDEKISFQNALKMCLKNCESELKDKHYESCKIDTNLTGGLILTFTHTLKLTTEATCAQHSAFSPSSSITVAAS